MNKLILTLAVMTTIVSCNKEEVTCNCETRYEKQLFGEWYVEYDEDYNLPLVSTSNDCSMDRDTTYTEPNKRQITTCK